MTDQESFGKLIYEEKRSGMFLLYRGSGILLLVIMIAFAAYSLSSIYGGNELSEEDAETMGLFSGVAVIVTPISIIILISSTAFCNLKVYETGIVLPTRRISKVLLGKQEYVQFRIVEEIVWDESQPFMVIRTKEGKKFNVLFQHIRNLDLFERALQGKVKFRRSSPPYTVS